MQYLERIPNEIIPKKAELISALKEQMQVPDSGDLSVTNDEKYEEMAKFMDTLPMDEQAQIRNMPPDKMENYVNQLMNQ